MSFNLYFYRRQGQNSLSVEQLSSLILSNEHMTLLENEHAVDFEYENPVTGVYFWLSFAKSRYVDEEIQQFDSFEFTGLTFGINFNRPSYFIYEANPIILKLVRTLGLYVYDPQADGASTTPYKPFQDELVHSWQSSNRRGASKSPNRVILPHKQALYAWEYLFQYPRIKRNVPQDQFVPKLFFVKMRDNSVKTAVVFPFPEAENQLIPEVDYLYIKTKKKQWLFEKQKEGLVSFETLRQKFPQAFVYREQPMQHYVMLDQNAIEEFLNECSVIDKEQFTVMANDGFVDVEPSPLTTI